MASLNVEHEVSDGKYQIPLHIIIAIGATMASQMSLAKNHEEMLERRKKGTSMAKSIATLHDVDHLIDWSTFLYI